MMAAPRAFAACVVLLSLPAHGQALTQDQTAIQAVGLFEHACLPFAGYAKNLRQWAASKALAALPPATAAAVLAGRSGVVFNASTADGKLALSSLDDGTCIVAMPSGNKDAVDSTLRVVYRTLGATVTLVSDRVSPDNKVMQTLQLVTVKKQSWHVSVTSHAHQGDMLARPTLIIMATATP